MLGDKRVPRGCHCQEPGPGPGINKRVSRRCQDGVKKPEVSRGPGCHWQEGVKRVSRGCQEGVRREPRGCQEVGKNM